MGINVTTNANEDSCDCYHNIQMNPLFLDAVNGDYHLTDNSPCIDAGDPASPLDPDGTIADMGAFYFDQSFPTKSGIHCFLTVSQYRLDLTSQRSVELRTTYFSRYEVALHNALESEV
jgi:hypothetical protein